MSNMIQEIGNQVRDIMRNLNTSSVRTYQENIPRQIQKDLHDEDFQKYMEVSPLPDPSEENAPDLLLSIGMKRMIRYQYTRFSTETGDETQNRAETENIYYAATAFIRASSIIGKAWSEAQV